MKKVLVIGRHPAHMEVVLRFLKEKGYYAKGETENKHALTTFAIEQFDVVVLGGGVDEASRKTLKEKLTSLNNNVCFIEHFGAPDSLPMEIEQAVSI